MATTIQGILEKIPLAEDPLEELEILKTALFTIKISNLSDIVDDQRFDVLFSLMKSDIREQVELCVDILGRLLMALSPLSVAENYKDKLEEDLNHPHDTVRIMILTQIGRVMGDPEAVTEILSSHVIFRGMILCMGDENIAVAKQAVQSLSKISQSKSGLDKLFQSDHLEVMKEMMGKSDTIRYRIYELMVEISSFSQNSLGYCANSGLLSQLLSELAGDNVTIRVMSLGMVTTLAHFPHGRQYLAQQGIMEMVFNMIKGADLDPLASLYLPGLVRFYGILGFTDNPQLVCEVYPMLLKKVFDMAMDLDPVMIEVALDTLGLLGSTVKGKQVLQTSEEDFKPVLLKISQHAETGTTELRVRSLDVIIQLLTLLPDDQTPYLLSMTESWFHLLSEEPMDMIRNISTEPLPELQCRAFRIFSVIATQVWGMKMMVNTPGFIEFILDRSTGQSKEAKDAKFELVGSLLGSSTAPQVLGRQNYSRLKAYRKEGPDCVPAVASVSKKGAA